MVRVTDTEPGGDTQQTTSEQTREEELLEKIREVRNWAVGCKNKQSDKRYEAEKEGDEVAAARFEGRQETYYVVEEMLVEKVLPLAEELAEDSNSHDI